MLVLTALLLTMALMADSGYCQTHDDSVAALWGGQPANATHMGYADYSADFGVDQFYSGQWVGRYDVEIVDSFAIVLTGYGLQVTDLPIAVEASVVNVIEIPERTARMASEDGVLYVATHEGILLYDVSALPSITQIGQVEHSWAPQDIKVADGFAYVLRDTCIEVFDCQDHSGISYIEEISLGDTYEWGIRLRVSGSTLFAGSRHLHAYDISDPFNIVPMYQIEARFFIYDVVQVDSTVIVADVSPLDRPEAMEIRAYNIADDTNIVQTSKQIFHFIGVSAMAKRNDTLFMTHRDRGVSLWDIGNPAEPELSSCFLLDGLTGEIYVDSSYLIVNCDQITLYQDSTVFGICPYPDSTWLESCDAPSETLPRPKLGGVFRVETSPSGFCIAGSFRGVMGAYRIAVRSDTVYTIDRNHGFTILDPSVGSGRGIISSISLPAFELVQFELCGDVAYVCATESGLMTVDIRDPENPIHCDTWSTNALVLDVACEGDIAVVANEYGGLVVLDISDRFHPTEIGRFGSGFFVNVELRDGVLYASSLFTGLWVVDMSLPASPQVLDTLIGSVGDLAIDGNLLATSISTGTRFYDLSTPVPTFISDWPTSNLWSIHMKDQMLFGARNEDGFVVLDVTDPESADTIAEYDGRNSVIDIAYDGGEIWTAGFGVVTGYNFLPPTDIDEPDRDGDLPTQCGLYQNYPNPFNPSTIISFSLPMAEQTTLTIYNALGQRVRTLVDSHLSAGDYTVEWDGTSNTGIPVATGVYFYRLTAGDQTRSQKMVLLK